MRQLTTKITSAAHTHVKNQQQTAFNMTPHSGPESMTSKPQNSGEQQPSTLHQPQNHHLASPATRTRRDHQPQKQKQLRKMKRRPTTLKPQNQPERPPSIDHHQLQHHLPTSPARPNSQPSNTASPDSTVSQKKSFNWKHGTNVWGIHHSEFSNAPNEQLKVCQNSPTPAQSFTANSATKPSSMKQHEALQSTTMLPCKGQCSMWTCDSSNESSISQKW
jgi:hypothetical protein